MNTFYIGWDVGAWYTKNKDAIVVLDSKATLVGKPWTGNLAKTISDSSSSHDFILKTIKLCYKSLNELPDKIILAIDAPLGFSEEFRGILENTCSNIDQDFRHNAYLFRKTEILLSQRGHKPLSSIQDRIGSQTTKAMHTLLNFAPNIQSCGIWMDGDKTLTAIETYPAVLKKSKTLKGEVEKLKAKFIDVDAFKISDKEDALYCAVIARKFDKNRNELVEPPEDIPHKEGWIWIPKDALGEIMNNTERSKPLEH